jgi:hypothetical protein
MIRRPGTVVLALATVTLAAGCGRDADVQRPARTPRDSGNVVGRTTTTSAALSTTSASVTPAARPRLSPRIEMASAVMRVTTARCEREATCGHVGTGRAFGDRDECANGVGHEIVALLPPGDCPSGVPGERLAACLAQIEAGSCDGADAEPLPASCALEQICAEAGGEP